MKKAFYFQFLFFLCLTFFKMTSGQCFFSCCDCEPNWDGFYISGQVGTGWNKQHAEFNNPNFFNTLGPTVLGSSFNFRSTGFVGGGALGYLYQCGYLVGGVEGSALSTNLKKTRSSPFFPELDFYTSDLNWIVTAKGKLGLAVPCSCLLVYVTGGWAGGHVTLNLDSPNADTFAKLHRWSNGWTAGVGADYQVFSYLSLGVAYEYVQLHYQNALTSCPNCGTDVPAGFGIPSVSDRFHTHIATFRINYHFNL